MWCRLAILTSFFIDSGKPQLVKQFKYIGLIKGGHTFYMDGGFNGGYPQNFSIETTVDDIKWTQRMWFIERDNVSGFYQPNSTYIFTMPELGPGSYKVRVIPSNSLGIAEQWEHSITESFTIEQTGLRVYNTLIVNLYVINIWALLVYVVH